MTYLNITDILPHKKENKEFIPYDSKYSIELTEIGLKKATIEDFSESLRICSKRKIPVFMFNDFKHRTTGISLFSSTFKEHISYEKTLSFFFSRPILPLQAIREIIICPDPIELLSYYQINKKRLDKKLLLAPHPSSKLSLLSEIVEYFPNAIFKCLFPRDNPFDILCSMAINLALTSKEYTINIKSPNIHIKLQRSEHIRHFEKIDYRFFRSVLRHTTVNVKNIEPPKEYYSFNEIINGK